MKLTCKASSSSWRTETRRVSCWFLKVNESISNSPLRSPFSFSFSISRNSLDLACSSRTPFLSTFTCTLNWRGNNKFTQITVHFRRKQQFNNTHLWILRGQFLVLSLDITWRQPLHDSVLWTHNCLITIFNCLFGKTLWHCIEHPLSMKMTWLKTPLSLIMWEMTSDSWLSN